MKYNLRILLGMIFMVTTPLIGHSQERPADLRAAADIFKNFSGYLDEDKKYHLEGEGYNVIIAMYPRVPNAGNYKNIAEAMTGKLTVLQEQMNGKPTENYVQEVLLRKTKPLIFVRQYLFPGKDKNILEVGIAHYSSVNAAFADEIATSIFYDGLYEPMMVDTKNNIIDFIGRKIKFDGDCFWLKPHVVKCTNSGMVSWCLFNSLAEAEAWKQSELWIARKDIGKKMHDTARVPVVFEGKKTVADRYLFENDEFSLGFKENRLVNAYYIAAEVRGRFVYCRLTFSDLATRKSDPDSGLPLLIAQFMKFQ